MAVVGRIIAIIGAGIMSLACMFYILSNALSSWYVICYLCYTKSVSEDRNIKSIIETSIFERNIPSKKDSINGLKTEQKVFFSSTKNNILHDRR
jgi:hypothetical protein